MRLIVGSLLALACVACGSSPGPIDAGALDGGEDPSERDAGGSSGEPDAGEWEPDAGEWWEEPDAGPTCELEESEDEICARLDRCNIEVTVEDSCGNPRTIECGECGPHGGCGLAGAPNTCFFEDPRDGERYGAVRIGDQIWMDRNLAHEVPGSYCHAYVGPYSGPCSLPRFGRYYTWRQAVGDTEGSDAIPSGVQGVCPPGWHLPSAGEWAQLARFVAEDAGVEPGGEASWYIAHLLKSTEGGTYGWFDSPTGVRPTDAYGLGLLPAGARTDLGVAETGGDAHLWTATAGEAEDTAVWFLAGNWEALQRIENSISFAAPVRCVKD